MNRVISAIFLLLMLSGCAGFDGDKSKPSQVAAPPRHFNFDQAVAAINTGKMAIDAMDYDMAISALEQGLTLWPAHQPGWGTLSHAYQMKGDEVSANYASYFAERIEWANSLDGSTAASAFDNVTLINKEKPFADSRIPQMAALLSAFYRQGQAQIRNIQSAEFETQQTFGQRYLIYPMPVVLGGFIVFQLLSPIFPK